MIARKTRRMTMLSFLAIALFITGCRNSSPTPAPLPNSSIARESQQPPEPASPQPSLAPLAPAQEPPGLKPTQPVQNAAASWPTDVLDVAWAPDSRRMAVLTHSGLAVLDVNSRSTVTWLVSVPVGARFAGWRYDGQAVYLQTSDNVLEEVDASGHIRALTERMQDTGISYFPSPDRPFVVRRWIGKISGKFQMIGGQGAWDGIFLNWSLRSRYLSYRNESATHLIDLQTGDDRALPWNGQPIWQPGDEHFLLVSGGTLRVMDVSGKVLTTIPEVRQATWSVDGTRILFTDTAAIWTVNADGSNKQLLSRVETGSIQGSLVWLAQDELVYLVAGKTGGGGTAFYPTLVAGGKTRGLSAGNNGVRPEIYVSPDRRHIAYISGPPSDSVPGALVLYPAP